MADQSQNYYVTIEDILMKAGFEKEANLADGYVKEARRAAQSKIDAACSDLHEVPFNPVPEKVRTLTMKLAAYSLTSVCNIH